MLKPLSFFRTVLSGPPGHQNIEGSTFVVFEFQSFPKELKIEIYDYRFQRPHPDPIRRSSPPTKSRFIRRHRRCRATVVALLRSPTIECKQTKLVIMTESGSLQSVIALRSEVTAAVRQQRRNEISSQRSPAAGRANPVPRAPPQQIRYKYCSTRST